MSRYIREKLADLEDFPAVDDKPEPMSDDECCRRAGELSHRLQQTIDAIEKQRHPATASDVATMHDVIDFLDRLGNDKNAEESFRGRGVPDSVKDGKSLAEWCDDDRRAGLQSKQVREWMQK
jgi:hypothetical protein